MAQVGTSFWHWTRLLSAPDRSLQAMEAILKQQSFMGGLALSSVRCIVATCRAARSALGVSGRAAIVDKGVQATDPEVVLAAL